MFEQRYYIITIMAVFLSLTLGIFIGNALLGNDLVIVQQQEVIEQLRQNYYKLQEENRSLQEQFHVFQVWEETNRSLEELILSLFRENTDFGARLIIVNTGGRELEPDLTSFFRQWGFDVSAICTIAHTFAPENEDLLKLVKGGNNHGISEREWRELVAYLAGALTGTRAPELLSNLAAKGFLAISGTPAAGIEAALLIGGEGGEEANRIEELERLLIETWLEEGVRVIVGARTGSGSKLEHYRRDGVSTIGHIDTAAGRLSLFYLLSSELEGHFGPGKETNLLLPLDWFREQVEAS
ncbi:MAG: copper transporter [bacterium]